MLWILWKVSSNEHIKVYHVLDIKILGRHQAKENVDDIQTLMDRMEAELNESDALDLDPTTKKIKATEKVARKSQARANSKVAGEGGSRISNDDRPVDFNLMKELLEEFKNQPGKTG